MSDLELKNLNDKDLETAWLLYQADKGVGESPSISPRRLSSLEQSCLIDYNVTLSEHARLAIECHMQLYHVLHSFEELEQERMAQLAFRGAAPPFNANLCDGKVEATVFEGGITVFLDPPDRKIEFQVEQRGDESLSDVCARAEDWVRYPQHAKLQERESEVKAVVDFVSWLKGAGTIDEQMAVSFVGEYFGVNVRRLEQEKRAMGRSGDVTVDTLLDNCT